MATQDLTQTTLQLVFSDGTDTETGMPIFKYKSFNNVKVDANPDQLLAVAKAFSDLQERPLYNIIRRDQWEIQEAE